MCDGAKAMIRSVFRSIGLDIVLLTQDQKRLLQKHRNLRYRHFAARDAIVMDHGQIGFKEAAFLGSLVRGLTDGGPIVELGTLFGSSTRVIALFKAASRELISVDNYSWNPIGFPPEMHFEITERVLSDAIRHWNVRLLAMDSTAFYNTYAEPSPAMVFIDADHSYRAVKADIEGARGLNAGIICGHDYDKEHCPGVVQAVEEAGGPSQLVDRLWVL